MNFIEAAAAKILPRDMPPSWFARFAAIALLWIALSLGDHLSFAISGAVTFALLLEWPPSNGKPEGGPKNALEWDLSKIISPSRSRGGARKSKDKDKATTENQHVKQPKGYREASRLVPVEELEKVPTDESSLKANMRKLANIESDRILSTKRIGRLGVNSDKILAAHFSQFGTVEQVLVCHELLKGYPDRSKLRVRPANTGFVVMSTATEALAALAAGSEQTVEGVNVVVSKYICRRAELGLDRLCDPSSDPTPLSESSSDPSPCSNQSLPMKQRGKIDRRGPVRMGDLAVAPISQVCRMGL